jgi:hypothetical protein
MICLVYTGELEGNQVEIAIKRKQNKLHKKAPYITQGALIITKIIYSMLHRLGSML